MQERVSCSFPHQCGSLSFPVLNEQHQALKYPVWFWGQFQTLQAVSLARGWQGMELRGGPGWAPLACQAVCTELCSGLVRGHRGVSPWCHICSLWWLLQAAGSIQRSPVHPSLCLQVTGWLWHYKVSLGPQMSPGHPWLLIPWGQCLALLLCTGSAQDELTPSLIAS